MLLTIQTHHCFTVAGLYSSLAADAPALRRGTILMKLVFLHEVNDRTQAFGG